MRALKTITLMGFSALALTACNSGTVSSDLVYNCPTDQVFTTITPYGDDADAPVLDGTDYAAYHKANGKRDGVTTTASGLQYKVAQKGLEDGASPTGGEMVTVHYHGYFPDGSVFDSSYERGETIQFPANGVIKGWIESLQDMKVCEARTLYIPGDLAYGPRGRPGIPENATLLFNVQLIGVEPPAGTTSPE
jgi:FKBP-type peptidyl-prolyl cis-trans isomerase FklB